MLRLIEFKNVENICTYPIMKLILNNGYSTEQNEKGVNINIMKLTLDKIFFGDKKRILKYCEEGVIGNMFDDFLSEGGSFLDKSKFECILNEIENNIEFINPIINNWSVLRNIIYCQVKTDIKIKNCVYNDEQLKKYTGIVRAVFNNGKIEEIHFLKIFP